MTALILIGLIAGYWAIGTAITSKALGNIITDAVEIACYTSGHSRTVHRAWAAFDCTMIGLFWPLLLIPLLAYTVVTKSDATLKLEREKAARKAAEVAERKAQEELAQASKVIAEFKGRGA